MINFMYSTFHYDDVFCALLTHAKAVKYQKKNRIFNESKCCKIILILPLDNVYYITMCTCNYDDHR